MADFQLYRKVFTTKSTIGELWRAGDSKPLCYILEDVARPMKVKIPGETAIPALEGLMIEITFSQRFQKMLPIIYTHRTLDGEDYILFDGRHKWRGVRIHPGNTDQDTEGCLLPGKTKAKDMVYESREAMKLVMMSLESVLQRQKTATLDIFNYQLIA